MDKDYEMQEVTISSKGDSLHFAALGTQNKELTGYFMDWWEEVGKEQFDGAIMDL